MDTTLLLSLAAVAGMLAHYVKKWGRKEITGNLFDYLIVDYPGNTIAALMTLAAALAAIVATGQLTGMQQPAIMALGFGAGWAIDSGVNKGAS